MVRRPRLPRSSSPQKGHRIIIQGRSRQGVFFHEPHESKSLRDLAKREVIFVTRPEPTATSIIRVMTDTVSREASMGIGDGGFEFL